MSNLKWFFGWVAYILVFVSQLCVGFLNFVAKLGLITPGSGYKPVPKVKRKTTKKTGK